MLKPVGLNDVTSIYTSLHDVGPLGKLSIVDPLQQLKGTTLANGGLKAFWDAGYTDGFPMWYVMPVKIGAAITVGDLVQEMYETVTCTDGTTTTAIKAGGLTNSTTDIWKGATIRCTLGAGDTNEGAVSLVTANSATVITFTPAWSTAVVNTDHVTLLRKYTAIQCGAGLMPLGIALATAAAGDIGSYMYVLRKGWYRGKVATGTAIAHGTILTSGASGVLVAASGYTNPQVAIANHVHESTTDSSTTEWVEMILPC